MKKAKYDFSQEKAISMYEITDAITRKYIKLDNKIVRSIMAVASLVVLINAFLVSNIIGWTEFFGFVDSGDEQIISVFKFIGNFFTSVVVVVVVFIACAAIYTTISAAVENVDENIKSNGARKEDVDFYYRLAPARVILSEINLKSMLRQPSKSILYKVMETGEYLIQPRLFVKKPFVRFVGASLGLTVLGMLSHIVAFDDVTISDSINFSIIIMASLIAVEFIYAAMRFLVVRSKLKDAVKADPIGGCGELNLRITNRPFWGEECWSDDKEQSDLEQFKTLGMNSFSDLIQMVGASGYIAKLIIRLEWLNVEALGILMESNKNSSLKMAQYREIYLINNKKLQCIIEDFIPTCMTELRTLIKRNNRTTYLSGDKKESNKKTSAMNEMDMTVFMKIETEVKKQGDLMQLIESQYQDMSENTTSSGFMSIIDNQKKGWLSYDEMGFSPKMQILETKLNESTVPEIEALMINANDEQKEVLKGKVLEIKSLVDEIAAKERQQLQ